MNASERRLLDDEEKGRSEADDESEAEAREAAPHREVDQGTGLGVGPLDRQETGSGEINRPGGTSPMSDDERRAAPHTPVSRKSSLV